MRNIGGATDVPKNGINRFHMCHFSLEVNAKFQSIRIENI